MNPGLIGILIPIVFIGSSIILLLLLKRTSWFKRREALLEEEARIRIRRKVAMQNAREKEKLRPIIQELLKEQNIYVFDNGEFSVACICGWMGLQTALNDNCCPDCNKEFTAFPRGNK